MARLRERRRKMGIENIEIMTTREQRAMIKRVAVALGRPEAEVGGMLAAKAAETMLRQVAQLELSLAS
jgi:hypothetical protein